MREYREGGKLGSEGIPGRWLEVEPSTRHPRPSGCRSWRRHLLASLWNFYLPSPNAMSPGEARPGAQKSCEQCLSEHPPSRAGTAQPPGRLPPLPTTLSPLPPTLHDSALSPAERASSSGRWCAGPTPTVWGSVRGPSRTRSRPAACPPAEVSRVGWGLASFSGLDLRPSLTGFPAHWYPQY